MSLTTSQREAVRRCQQSVCWFLANFGKLKHPSAGILPFHPFSYQRTALRAFRKYKFNCFRKCRQAGVSKISGAFALWFAMFYSHKTILIVSRTDDTAMEFLRDQVMFLYDHLPQWMKDKWAPTKRNEHEVEFPNGSKIKSLTSHPDVLRSNASSLNIIDEAAFINNMDILWAGGWSCARYNTLVQTNNGLVQLGSIGDPLGAREQKVKLGVATDNGYTISDGYFINGEADTRIITTSLGFEFEATGNHKLRVIDAAGDYVWRDMADIVSGDTLVSMPGQFKGKRQRLNDHHDLDEELAEIIGQYVGDGSVSRKPHRLIINFDPQDIDACDKSISVLNRVVSRLGFPTRAYQQPGNGTVDLRINSAPFINLIDDAQLTSKTNAHDAGIPEAILKSDKAVLCAFLRGLFEADGWCYQSQHVMNLGLSSASKKLIDQVQIALHALGIISRTYLQENADGRYSDEPCWRLDVKDAANKVLFREMIGFISDRKSNCLRAYISDTDSATIDHPVLVREFASAALLAILGGKSTRQCKDSRYWNLMRIRRQGCVRLDLVRQLSAEFKLVDRLSAYINNGYYFDVVSSIRVGKCATYDLSVPNGNSYLGNGLISHNTLQHGGNVIIISTCVVPDTIIQTKNGFQRISELEPFQYDGFNDGYYHAKCDLEVASPSGNIVRATKFYKRDLEATKKIKTKLGYELEASLLHRINTFDGYRYTKDLNVGDYIPIRRGNNIFGDNDYFGFVDTGCLSNPSKKHGTSFIIEEITEELAYMLGGLTAEGSFSETYVSFVNGDKWMLDKFRYNSLGLKWVTESRPTHLRCNSTRLVRFLKWIGFKRGRAWQKEIPYRLWSCSKKIISAYLRGLFDGDGHSRTRDGEVALTSTSRELIKQVRIFLLNYGIICREEFHKAYTKQFALNGKVYHSECRESWQLIIRSGEAEKFYESIGFGLAYKGASVKNCKDRREYMPVVALIKQFRNESGMSISSMNEFGIRNNTLFGRLNRPNIVLERNVVERFLASVPIDLRYLPSYQRIKEVADPMIYWDQVESLEDGVSEVMDFTIPKTAAFWSAGFDSHNTNGVGNWFWSTVTDSEAGLNQFNPIRINWWDMDWIIEYTDALSREHRRIAPRDGLIECKGQYHRDPKYGEIRLDQIRYGPYWSPWLESQYRALQEKGEAWKFDQEVLAQFVGSGNTVLSKEVLAHVQTTVTEPTSKVKGLQVFVHPQTGHTEYLDFDFNDPDEGLWLWALPILAVPQKKRGNIVVERGSPAHSYIMGVDFATGRGRDYSTIEVFDLDTQYQVAEFMAHCLPREFVKYIDRVGRWYNCALAVVERNNGGDTLIDSLRYDMMYPRIWRKRDINDKPRPMTVRNKQRPIKVAQYGFATSVASKPILNKHLIDLIRAPNANEELENGTYTILSKRLLKQFNTYVRKRDRSGRDTHKTEAEDGAGNFDDLVMACALALVGTRDAYIVDGASLAPIGSNTGFKSQQGPIILTDGTKSGLQKHFAEKGGAGLLMPMALAPEELPETSAQRQLDAYTCQLGAIPISQGRPLIVPKRFYYTKE